MTIQLPVEETYKHVRSVWREVRRCLKMRDHRLDVERMSDIQGLLPQIAEAPEMGFKLKGTAIPHYELGYAFIVEHLIEMLKRQVQLNRLEERLVRASLGKTDSTGYYAQLKSRAHAAEKLSKLGARGNQIFFAIAKELWENLRVEHLKPHKVGGDTFGNPLSNICTRFEISHDRWSNKIVEKDYFDEMRQYFEVLIRR